MEISELHGQSLLFSVCMCVRVCARARVYIMLNVLTRVVQVFVHSFPIRVIEMEISELHGQSLLFGVCACVHTKC